jgi:hypothetical protein
VGTQERLFWDDELMLLSVVQSNHLHVLKWVKHNSEHTGTAKEMTDMLVKAAEYGLLDRVE